MNIIFLSYWGINDPLTVSTVFPHLQILQGVEKITKIVLVTIERDKNNEVVLEFRPDFFADKVVFKPLLSRQNQPLLLNKLDDFVRFPRELASLAQQYKIEAIVSRGAPAGALAYLVWRKKQIPFLVESFEPHADYMLESGVWQRYDPRFIFESYWEDKQKKVAAGLMPVAENYRTKLLQEGVLDERIVTVPCSVKLDAFQYNETQRRDVRTQLLIPEQAVVGIYVGKFGGMYYEAEAFSLFQSAAEYIGKEFRLIILTPTPATRVYEQLEQAGFDKNSVFVTKALPTEVPAYLSAADFAFATYKKGPAKQFLSPIKVGEYWATGLPVLLTEGVGDDSAIIKRQGGGATFDMQRPETVNAAFSVILQILKDPHHRADIRRLAEHYRSVEKAREAYQQLLLPLAKTSS